MCGLVFTKSSKISLLTVYDVIRPPVKDANGNFFSTVTYPIILALTTLRYARPLANEVGIKPVLRPMARTVRPAMF